MLLRSPQARDAEAVAELLAPRELAAFGRREGTLAELLAEWGSSEFDLARDAIVADAGDGAPAGYAVAHRFGTFAAVDPAREGEGIGAALLDWCERRQREAGLEAHRTSIAAKNTRARDLLVARGYQLARSDWRMTLLLARLDGAPMTSIAPDVTLRTLDADADGAALHALDGAAFATDTEAEAGTAAAFVEEHLRAADLDSSLSRVAERRGEIVGFALTRRRTAESAAYIDILAVHPRAQGRGIGSALLLAVFRASRRAGLSEAQLGVSGDNPGALRLYERLGMRTGAQLDIYTRPIEHRTPPTGRLDR